MTLSYVACREQFNTVHVSDVFLLLIAIFFVYVSRCLFSRFVIKIRKIVKIERMKRIRYRFCGRVETATKFQSTKGNDLYGNLKRLSSPFYSRLTA